MPIVEDVEKRPDFLPLAENNSVGEAGRALKKEVEKDLSNTVIGSVYWAATILLGKAQTRLFDLAALKSNWDSYGAPAPNKTALENGLRILKRMNPFDLDLVNIVPSAEGGIGFCFVSDDRYADIESSNDGEIIGVRYTGTHAPILIEMDGTDASIEAALQQIRNHVRA